jgi:hypothetical protein
MPSPVSICSNALLMLGDNPISAFDEATDRARMAANLWPSVRDYVLRSHPWNCAVKRVVLAPMVDAPAFDFGAQFQLPSDFLRLLSVGLEGEKVRFKLETIDSGRVILQDGSACYLRYIWRNENADTYDGMLIHALQASMRTVFSYGVTQSTSLEQLLHQVLQPILKQARAVDASEEDHDPLDDSPLLDARWFAARPQYRGSW